MPTQKESPADQLAKELRRHRALYYAGTPEISDEEFDALEDRLRELAPDHPALAEVGAPVESPLPQRSELDDAAPRMDVEKLATLVLEASDAFYGDRILLDKDVYKERYLQLSTLAPSHRALSWAVPAEGVEWSKGTHEIPMGSLNKVNSPEELTAWAHRCDELADLNHAPRISNDLIAAEKLDGISIELLYIGGTLDAAITRGDGLVGERITPNVSRMRGVPAAIARGGSLSVRGEVIIRRSDAEEFRQRKSNIDSKFDPHLSLRNFAAGQARAKAPRLLPLCSLLSVVAYDIEGVEGLDSEGAKFELLRDLGFATPHLAAGDLGRMLHFFAEYAGGRRAAVDYEIDGLVIRANAVASQDALGELNNRSRAAVAFKFPSEMKVSELLDVLWETGPTGRITPVAIVKTVRLVGAKISRASLHNRANVERLSLGIGDDVLVSRRNDVIPYIERVVVRANTPRVQVPEICSACGHAVSREGEYLMCRNEACPSRRLGRVQVWVRQLGLLEWGDKTIESLFEAGLVQEVPDLYTLDVTTVAELPRLGRVQARKLLEPLHANKDIPIATFISALGIEGVSLETAKILVQAGYETFEAMLEAKPEDLAALEGLGSIKAERIVAGLRARREEVERLAAVGVRGVPPAHGGPLAGLSFCFSGAATRPRKRLHQLVEKNGGAVATGVKKGLDYLVLEDADSGSSKAQKARKLGTQIIDEATFDRMILERGGSLEA